MNSPGSPFFNDQVPIDAYGNGGFRFADMSHRGSILCLPSGIYGWPALKIDDLSWNDFLPVAGEADIIEIVLLGTGDEQIFPPAELRNNFEDIGTSLEPMTTGAAVRTYNVLLAEKRSVAAALIAVENAGR